MSISDTTPSSPRKLLLFRLLSLLTAFACGAFLLAVVEWSMRWNRRSMGRPDVLDPAMVRYDPELGWALNPDSNAGHTNSDFGTVYRIASSGFRADSVPPVAYSGKLQVFLGDSFVFGFGVPEEQTFVHLLNVQASAHGHFLNCGVPGFSTDQESLLLDRILNQLKPEVVWLVVYLANDLLDIRQGRAIQVNQPKPYFELVQGRLELRQNPVPRLSHLDTEGSPDLASAILGREFYRGNWRASLERRSVLFQRLSESFLPVPIVKPSILDRLPPALDLFAAILASMEERCLQKSVHLRVVFMPGRSMVERPESIPGQYQALLLSALHAHPVVMRLNPLDLSPALAASNRIHRGRYFFPNDGHLTRDGHLFVANAVRSALD